MAYLTDETWASLDPAAGRPDRRGRRSVTTALLVLGALFAGVCVVAARGGLTPDLFINSSAASAGSDGRFTEELVVHNPGVTDARVEVLPRRGLELVSGSAEPVPAHGKATLRVRYRVRDCATVGFPLDDIRLRVHRVGLSQVRVVHYDALIEPRMVGCHRR